MAGSNPRFDGHAFRAGIREAMLMALPHAKPDQPLFRFAQSKSFTATDEAGHPFDWDETVDATGKQPRRVLCIVDTHDKPMPVETPIGPFRADQPDLYLFEKEWAQVHDFVSVEIAGANYVRVETLVPVTMFDVTLHHVRVKTEDRP